MVCYFFSLRLLLFKIKYYICTPITEKQFDVIILKFTFWYAGVVELVDTLDLGSSAARRESSSLSACTR